jgi:hypothetical protein
MAHFPTQLNSIHSGQRTSPGVPSSPPQLGLAERVNPLVDHGGLHLVGPALSFLLQDAWVARDFGTIRALLERRVVEPDASSSIPDIRKKAASRFSRMPAAAATRSSLPAC